MTTRVPKVGDALNIDDLEMIIEAVEQRQRNFPDEPSEMTLALVFFNIGDRFAPVTCINGEWSGLKKDIPKGNPQSIPKCPNNHVLTMGPGLRLGWIDGE